MLEHQFYDEVLTKAHKLDLGKFFASCTEGKVRRAINRDGQLDWDDFLALLSPAAVPLLEDIAQKAHEVTVRQFGYTIQLFTPIYVSDYCTNRCAYCGFNASNKMERRKLSIEEVDNEGKLIAESGLRHILLLTGESRKYSPPEYIADCIKTLHKYFPSVCIEVYSMTTEEYKLMVDSCCDGMTMFQETYNPEVYDRVHLGGPKKDYHFRLDSPMRAGMAGMRTLNVGALLGLDDWRAETFATGLHARWLEDNFEAAEISISLPRLRPHLGMPFTPKCDVTDAEFVQILMAHRLFSPRCGITISTRETAEFREKILPLGVTRLSAGASTEVGKRINMKKTDTAKVHEGQFKISDNSSVNEIRDLIRRKHYQPVYVDWL